MKVSYYCQHVLGIGHFHRSMEICRAIARHHPTTLIIGGPAVAVDHPAIQVLRLPGLQMDSTFHNMVPCDTDLSLDAVKAGRKDQLFAHFRDNRPDIFITELYPFGRKGFRFELDPLLEAIDNGSLPDCLCFCSVRDILVEKTSGREKFEQRAVKLINDYFDGILVHADPEIITLNETFSQIDALHVPLHYTGFVTKSDPIAGKDLSRVTIRKKLALATTDTLIVASIGGGNVGSELLYAAIEAFTILRDAISAHLQIFCGPYCDEKTYQALLQRSRGDITVERFTDHFPAWLAAADLSISMAGYNTCMNLVQAGIPSLVYPFRQNREQRLRAEKLARKVPMTILEDADLPPILFAKKMAQQLENMRYSKAINLDGAEETAKHLARWYTEHLKSL
ncbi:glycosyl transferase [Desulfopila sp. IMCC35006]|uniref:glycosyltransferase family protein n=1 Tax=Desulfopila sp. IMCC35006 TaxID=2569542 RepID=UPI0010AD38C6|nr:glycosyltransferase [Desulfopila sp. IMCC35006]TKB23825.1 glycosyl transferase [Desulfopila sp. IMCC35006]